MILVIGLGFVGLTTAVGLASKGFTVQGYDINHITIKSLKEGKVQIHEPGLEKLLHKNLERLSFLKNLEVIDSNIDLIFICVGTPYNLDGSADLSQVYSAIDSIERIPNDYLIDVEIVIKSTVPPGSSKAVLDYIISSDTKLGNFKLFNNPEFLREGFALSDFLAPDRIVIGTANNINPEQTKIVSLYRVFNSEIIFTNYNTSEFIKYLSNTLLSTLISFSNELSIIADFIGDISVKTSFEVLHKDFRLKDSPIKSYIYPGFGYGGYCLPKDTMALNTLSSSYGYKSKILLSNIMVNEEITNHVVEKITRFVSKTSKIGILGLSFKEGSDDVRETKSYSLIKRLIDAEFKNIVCHDPISIKNFQSYYTRLDVSYEHNLDVIIREVDVLIVSTPWEIYKDIINSKSYKNKLIFDLKYSQIDFMEKNNA